MNLFTEQDCLLATATACSTLALLIWSDRHRLLGLTTIWRWLAVSLYISLYIFIPVISGVATLLWYQFYSGGSKTATVAMLLTQSATTEASAGLSDDTSLIMTVLGLFVALITGITITITRHSMEDVRRASEEQAKQHEKNLADLYNRYRDKEVSSLLEELRITVIAGIANAQNNDELQQSRINSIPLLVSKLQFLNEARSFRKADFSSNNFNKRLKDMKDAMINDNYQGHLQAFFSRDDLVAFDALLTFLCMPTAGGVPHRKYKQAAEVLEPFISQLEEILRTG